MITKKTNHLWPLVKTRKGPYLQRMKSDNVRYTLARKRKALFFFTIDHRKNDHLRQYIKHTAHKIGTHVGPVTLALEIVPHARTLE